MKLQKVDNNNNQFYGNNIDAINYDEIEEKNNNEIVTNIKQKPKIVCTETLNSIKILIKKDKNITNETRYETKRKSAEKNNQNCANLVLQNQSSRRSSLKFINNGNY